MSEAPLETESLAERFMARSLSPAEWTHQAHLAVGLWHVERFGRDEAMARLRHGIRTLNESFGNQNTETSGYHETITWAYVELLAQFSASCPEGMPLAARVARLLGSPLVERDVLQRFYSNDLLISVEARAGQVAPDLAPVLLSGIPGMAAAESDRGVLAMERAER